MGHQRLDWVAVLDGVGRSSRLLSAITHTLQAEQQGADCHWCRVSACRVMA